MTKEKLDRKLNVFQMKVTRKTYNIHINIEVTGMTKDREN